MQYPSPHLFPTSSLPQNHLCLPSEKNRKDSLPWTSTKPSITNYNNTRHTPSHQGWTRQPSRKERSHKQTKESEIAPPAPTIRNPTSTPSYSVIT